MNSRSPATTDELTRAPQRLRHVAVVGARGHGKTALIRALAAASEPVERVNGAQPQDPSLAITSLVYAADAVDEGGSLQDHLIQMIDTPGSLDGVMDIFAALALADGVIVVVDPAEGVRLLVDKVVTEAVARRKKLVLVLNSGEARPTPIQAWYEPCVATIAAVNAVIKRACSDCLLYDEWSVGPARGNVVVGSAVFGWGFPFPLGDLEDAATEPCQEREVVNHGDATVFDDHDKWLDQPMDHSFGESVLSAIICHLPPPVKTHQFVCAGDSEHDWSDAVRRCDPHGPLVVHVVRFVQGSHDSGELLAIGRVLSGTVRTGQQASVVTPDALDATWFVVHSDTARITSARLASGHEREIPAGNICALLGVGDHLNKYGILTTCAKPESVLASRFFHRLMREATPPSIVRVALHLRNPEEEAKFLSVLRQLNRLDLASTHAADMTKGVVILMGISPAHLQQCLSRLESSGLHEEVSYTVSESYAFFQETVTARSPQQIVAKSPNRHIRLVCNPVPLEEAILRKWRASDDPDGDAPNLATRLVESHGWTENEEATLRSVAGPLTEVGPNLLVDCQHTPPRPWHLIKTYVSSGFEYATRMGVLCGERVVGLRIDLVDTLVHGLHERHWRISQGFLAMRTGVFASQLMCSPALLEAFVAVEINGRDGILIVEGLHELLALKRGRVVNVDLNKSTVRALVPSREVWGLEEAACSIIGRRVTIEMILDHYERLEGDPLDPATPAGSAVRDLRIRKGESPEITPLSELPVMLSSRHES